jgi:hypothetical protein
VDKECTALLKSASLRLVSFSLSLAWQVLNQSLDERLPFYGNATLWQLLLVFFLLRHG